MGNAESQGGAGGISPVVYDSDTDDDRALREVGDSEAEDSEADEEESEEEDEDEEDEDEDDENVETKSEGFFGTDPANFKVLDPLNLVDTLLFKERNRSSSVGNRSDYSENTSNQDNEEVSEKSDPWSQAKIDAAKYLTPDEIIRAERVFYHCDTFNDKGLSEDQVGVALALLGQIEKTEVVREVFAKFKVDPMPKHVFLLLLCDLRERRLTEGQSEAIGHAFDALYSGTCPNDTNRDESGRRFILASELRYLLTSKGDKLTDEEADMLIRECKPIYTENAEGVRRGLIFLEQYRTMLLDKAL